MKIYLEIVSSHVWFENFIHITQFFVLKSAGDFEQNWKIDVK